MSNKLKIKNKQDFYLCNCGKRYFSVIGVMHCGCKKEGKVEK